MDIAQALQCSQRLHGISDSPRLDVERLLGAVLDKPASYLLSRPETPLTEAQQQQFMALLARRCQGEPVAYLLGWQGFWTLDLEVSRHTLIPRPDTETLVEQLLARFDQAPRRLVDLGTGSGAIALALASERPGWEIWGVDRIPEAVELAERNRQRLRLDRVQFVCGDWLTPLAGRFDLIVSNPPYIDPADPHLQQGDVRFEPHSALVADDAGLADIRTIARAAPAYLNPGGWLVFEHGYNQAEAVRTLLARLGYQRGQTLQDYAANDRVTLACWEGCDAQ